jgi:hypothetical protein
MDLDIGELFDLVVHGDYALVVVVVFNIVTAVAGTVQTRAVPSWSLPST